jgi:hypothetical protein
LDDWTPTNNLDSKHIVNNNNNLLYRQICCRINRLLSAYIYLDDSLRLFESMNLKQNLEIAAGKLCEILIPIKHEYYTGGGTSIAICTLSSIDLLQTIAAHPVIHACYFIRCLTRSLQNKNYRLAASLTKRLFLKQVTCCLNKIIVHQDLNGLCIGLLIHLL